MSDAAESSQGGNGFRSGFMLMLVLAGTLTLYLQRFFTPARDS